MRRVVALLRGVNNIGSAKRIAMADLKTLVEELGFLEVRTLLNSGNVVFTLPTGSRGDPAARIEKRLTSRYGIRCRVTVLSAGQVASVVRDNPLAGLANTPSHMLIVVPAAASDQVRLRPLLEKRWGREKLALGKRVAYLWCAEGVADSRLWPAVDRALERTGTARNMATMRRILAGLR